MTPSYDLHIHTALSACCPEKDIQLPAQILALAQEMGLEAIGFSDHVWANPDVQPSAWYAPQGIEQITRLRHMLAELSSEEKISDATTSDATFPRPRILVGCEAETIAPGVFGMTADFAATLDFVLLSCSHIHMKDFVAQPSNEQPYTIAMHLLEMFRSGVCCPWATSIAHPLVPFGRMENYAAIMDSMPEDALQEACGLAAEKGVALEITTSFLPSTEAAHDGPLPWSMETPLRLITTARDAGCRFTFGTDAHVPERQKGLPALAELVSLAGLTPKDILPIPSPRS